MIYNPFNLSSEISYIQFAFNGIWENTYKIYKQSDFKLETINDLKNEIAFELFLNDNKQKLFIGIRYCNEEIDKNWISNKVEYLLNSDLSDIIKSEIGEEFLDKKHLQKIEIGVVDYWKSIGSNIVWKKGSEIELDKETVASTINKKLCKSKLNYQAVEFAYQGLHDYWIGYDISIKNNLFYEIDIDKLQNLIKERI